MQDTAVDVSAPGAEAGGRRLAVWLAAASAPAAMVAVGWYGVVRLGGVAGGGDMVGHAAAAQWLRTLPWWDWRGWSGWFYGGQAIGVNYPPLGHAWLRLTHPFHGQLAAVAVGLLVLLPWGALRLARSVGLDQRAQGAAAASVLVVASASGGMHWVLSGFHSSNTFFGGWPAMLAVVCGLFSAAWAARCTGALRCGAVVGLAVLLNVSVVPGTAVVCAVLLATSGASLRQAARWTATAAAAALAVCAWWLVPFVAGWGRLVRWEVPLSDSWRFGGLWQEVVLAAVGVCAVWAALRSDPAKRLTLAAYGGLVATVAAALAGYLRPERWLETPILVAACAVAGLAAGRPSHTSAHRLRPTWRVVGCASLVALALIVDQHEILALAGWLLLWRPGRVWVWAAALAWFAVLSWVPIWGQLTSTVQPEPEPGTVMEGIAELSGPDAGGMVYLAGCDWSSGWRTAARTEGRIRPTGGLYIETSPTSEFFGASAALQSGLFGPSGVRRPHWYGAWEAADRPALDGSAAAVAAGARWHGWCHDGDDFTMSEVPVVAADGVRIVAYPDEDSWHRAAAQWWIALAASDFRDSPTELDQIPVLWPGAEREGEAARVDQAARGLSLRSEQDRLFVTAESSGWAWVRVPWDPWWSAADGVPLKGGPGHLVVWVEPGVTELRWDVPTWVDAMAAAVTGMSLLLLAVMVRVNRREGWDFDPERPRPAADALNRFADAADRRLVTAGQAVRSASHGSLPGRQGGMPDESQTQE